MAEGNRVKTHRRKRTTETVPRPEDIPLNILYEDADIVVRETSPVGMVVLPSARLSYRAAKVNALLLHFGCNLSCFGGEMLPGIRALNTSGYLPAILVWRNRMPPTTRPCPN